MYRPYIPSVYKILFTTLRKLIPFSSLFKCACILIFKNGKVDKVAIALETAPQNKYTIKSVAYLPSSIIFSFS